MASGQVTLNGATYLLQNDDDGNAQAAGIRGSERKQDLTPSTDDQVQGVPGDTTIATGSTIVYGDATGAVGLLDRLTSPGDLARPYLSELDNTRPRQLTAWVGPATATALGTRNLAATADANFTLFDGGAAFGFITKSASATYDLWQWDTASSAYKFVRANYLAPAVTALSGYVSRQSYGTFRAVPQIATDYAGGLWYAAVGGLVNAAVAGTAAVGDANAAATLVYLDMLWSFGLTATGITITPYRFASGSTPATAGAQVQKIDMAPGSATYGTAINTVCTIPGEYAILGVVASESNVFLVTDRSVYRIGWNDGPNTFEFTRLPVEVPNFTSNPCSWNGELWIGAGNQIVHIVPGQRTYDTVLVDDLGNSPAPFSGRVALLYATHGYLAAQLIDDLTTTPQNAAIMLRNSDGAWYDLANAQSFPWAAQLPMLKKIDANGFALAAFASASLTALYPLLSGGKNPRNLSVSLRSQRGVERIIMPWEYGKDEASLKQLLRCRLQVLATGAFTASTQIRAYYQLDYDENISPKVTLGGQTFLSANSGIASAITNGQWTVGAVAAASMLGDYGSALDGSGNGYLWTEFDGTAATASAPVSGTAITDPVTVNDAGAGYTTTSNMTILPASGTAFRSQSNPGAGATFTPALSGGALASLTRTAGGAGYTGIATPILVMGGARGAAAVNNSPFSGNIAYPKFHRIRWMFEIGGDTTGTLVPTLQAFLFEFWEYPKVGYQYALSIRMRVGDPQITNGTKVDGTAKSKYDTPAAVVADRDALESLKNNRTIVAYTGLDGHTINVLVTKISHDTLSVDSSGIQESISDVILQVAPLQGTV